MNASKKNAELQQLLDSERKTFASDKKILEETIVDMSSSAAHSQTDEAERASVIKLQEERAVVSPSFTKWFSSLLTHCRHEAAEERYQREIVSHAESIKTVENLKQQLSTVQGLVREKQTAADTAQSMLATAEASWKSQREALDKEITDVNSRCVLNFALLGKLHGSFCVQMPRSLESEHYPSPAPRVCQLPSSSHQTCCGSVQRRRQQRTS
jgi:nucleoprotein TPR